MAYIMKRKFPNKISFLAQVKRKGFKTITKSFGTKTLAQKWARAIERKHDIGDYSDYTEASKLTFGDLLIRYRVENKHRAKKIGRMKDIRLISFLRIQSLTLTVFAYHLNT